MQSTAGSSLNLALSAPESQHEVAGWPGYITSTQSLPWRLFQLVHIYSTHKVYFQIHRDYIFNTDLSISFLDVRHYWSLEPCLRRFGELALGDGLAWLHYIHPAA